MRPYVPTQLPPTDTPSRKFWKTELPKISTSIKALNSSLVSITAYVQEFDTVASVQAFTFPNLPAAIQTLGYYTVGDDGGATYVPDSGAGSGNIQSADGQWWKLSVDGVVSVKQFGAKGDGSTIDTTAINAAYGYFVGKSGTVVFPVGNYQIDDTIKIGVQNGTNVTSFISTWSSGSQDGTQLRWVGGNNKLVLGYYKNKGSTMENIRVVNQNGATGCTGFGLGGYGTGDFGNSSLGNTFRRCEFGASGQSFDTAGISGINFGCGSECAFINCNFDGSVVGFTHTDFNSLDFLFLECGFGHAVGYDTGASAGPHVIIGGSSTGNSVADFLIGANAGRGTIIFGYRSEDLGLGLPSGQSAVFVKGDTAGGFVTVSSCSVIAPRQGIAIRGQFAGLALRDSHFEGWINPSPVDITQGFLEITSCDVIVDPSTNLPFIGNASGRVKCKNNRDAFSGTMCLDVDGNTSGSRGTNAYPFSCGLFIPTILQVPELDRLQIPANTGQPFGVNQLGLCYVKQLSEGPLPGMFRQGAPDSLTTTGLTGVAGNNYLTYTGTMPNTLIPGMVLQNLSNASLDFLTVTYVDGNNKVVGLNGNVGAAGTSSGQTVKYFLTMASALTRGKNLRVQAQFATSGTLAFTFTRTLTVSSIGGSSKIVANTGNFFPADAGKPILIAGAGSNGWTDWCGHIATYDDATHVEIYSPVSLTNSFAAATATIGENEPDGNWRAYGLVVDANETIWVDTYANTGCTVHSSNAASTATVNFLIVR